MGNCTGTLTPEQRRNREINKRIKMHNIEDSKVIKILLLGTGESGKSTIFKQVRQLYSPQKFSQKDLMGWKENVVTTVNKQVMALVKNLKIQNIDLEDPSLLEKLSKVNEKSVITEEVGTAMAAFWKDKGVQKLWKVRAEFPILQCTEYYLKTENISRIADEKYIPTFDDMIYARVITTGVTSERFQINRAPFEMYDVGGQKSERKKWLQCFNNVTTVIFVAAMSEYDQKLFAEESEDCMDVTLNVWADCANRDEFVGAGIVLFLNKFDLFAEKVQQFPYRVAGKRNNDYTGPDPVEVSKDKNSDEVELEAAIMSCAEHTRRRFMKEVDDERRQMSATHVYFTNATSTDNMKLVFDNCEEQILRINLDRNGFGPSAHGHARNLML